MLILARLLEHPPEVRNHESLLIAALPARSGAAAPSAAALAAVCGQLAGAGTGEGFWLEQGALLQTNDSVLSPDVLAVFAFYYREEAVLIRRLTQTLGAIGDEFGEFLSHRRGPLHPPL